MKKKELIIILGSLLVVVLSVTLAYFTTEIFGTGKDISLDSANLKITFSSGSGNISGVNIEPGWSSGISTFTVKNESNDTYKYNIVIKELVNTFVTTGFLKYKITSADGGYNMSDFKDVPKSITQKDTILAYSVEIAKGTTHTYSVEFKYENSTTEDQSDDMGKKLSGTLFIEKGTDKPLTLAEKIIEDRTIETTTRGGAYNTVFTEDTTGKLFQTTESIAGAAAKTVYYFAGAPTDNWLKFANFYWRLIRTNHDGSIRLLYAGTSPDTTSGYIGTSAFNSSYNSPKYAGYMYGTDGSLSESRTNTNDSTIKTYIDNWYSTNLSSYTKYISTEAVYCNDRQLDSGQTWSISYEFDYITYTRLDWAGNGSNASPIYDCADSHDAFSATNADAKLTYPISLMTADEINIAGGLAGNEAPAYYYLNSAGGSVTGSTWWWSLSPVSWMGDYPHVWLVYGSGYDTSGHLEDYSVNDSYGVRPVISIKADALWSSGDGSSASPYEIVYN